MKNMKQIVILYLLLSHLEQILYFDKKMFAVCDPLVIYYIKGIGHLEVNS